MVIFFMAEALWNVLYVYWIDKVIINFIDEQTLEIVPS